MSGNVPTALQKRMGRRDWVNAAIDVMVASSVEQVRVEKLANTIGVSKGSFYWHFKDREELLTAVLEQWRDRATLAVHERLAKAEPLARRRILLFMRLPLRSAAASRAADLELAIIGWARRSEDVRNAVERVDEARTAQLAGLFRELGAAEAEAVLRAHQAYAFLRYVAQRRDLDVAVRNEMIERVHARLVEDLREA